MTTQTDTSAAPAATTTTETAPAAPTTETQPSGGAAPAATTAPATAATTEPTPEEAAAKATADAAKAADEAKAAEHKARLDEVKKLAQQTRAKYLETEAAKNARISAERAVAQAQAASEALQKERDDLLAKLAEVDKDPWAYGKSKGLTAAQVAERELEASTDDAKLKELSDRIAAADKRAEEAEKKAQAIIDAAKEREERAARVEAWETAKAAAVQTFESGKEKLADLHAWVDKQASKSGANRADILVEEMLSAVNRIKANPKTAPYADQYTDAEILEAINARYDGFSKVSAPPPPAATAAPTSIASATQVTAPPTQATDTKTPGAPQASNGTAQKPPPTLTNAQASTTQTATVKPEDFDSWSDRKQNAWLAEQLRAGTLTKL